MKPILIHTHFHRRRTGVTRSIENVFPFFAKNFESYIYGYNVEGQKISFSKLRKILFSDRETVVHCHRNNEIIRMLFYRFLGAKFKIVATRHAETPSSRLTLRLLKKADSVVTLIASMGQSLGVKNTVIGHGVNVAVFSPKREANIKDVSQENIILCAGRVRKAKGQIVLLEAAKILKNHKNWALVIVGKVDKPVFLEKLKEISKKHDIEGQVYFVEETKNIIPYYQAAKLVVVPSFSEGFSLVTAEAMSCECSVIATKNVGVHSSLITSGKNGYLFEPGNSAQLSSLILKFIKKEIPHLGETAREEIIKNWSAKKEAENLVKVYTSFF